MRSTNRLNRAVAALVAILCLPGAARAVVESDTLKVAMTAGTEGAAEVAGQLPAPAIVHGFTVHVATELLGAEWEVVVLNRLRQPLARLTHTRSTLVLPRPLGYLLEAADTFVAVARVRGAARETELELVVEYDVVRGAGSRIGVRAMIAAQIAENTTQRTWEIRTDQSARLLALGGAAVESAHEITLIDAQTGAIVWRIESNASPAFRQASDHIRLGAALEGNRTYLLTTVFATAPADAEPLRALILAAR